MSQADGQASARQASARGRCLCGAVAFELRGPLRPVINCHCGQCRRTHGHVAAYTNLPREKLSLTEDRGLKWYASSASARRGFCAECGASLFWDLFEGDAISVAAGTLDEPSGLDTAAEIFTADKGDYYELAGGLKTYPGGLPGG